MMGYYNFFYTDVSVYFDLRLQVKLSRVNFYCYIISFRKMSVFDCSYFLVKALSVCLATTKCLYCNAIYGLAY